jgi:hypothetical protein
MNLDDFSKPDLSKIIILPETIEALKLSIWMDLHDPFDPYIPRMRGDWEDVQQDLLDAIGESVKFNQQLIELGKGA